MMNAFHDVWLDTYIMQIINQEQLERLRNYMETN